MQDGIGAPRSPTLRVCQQLRCAKTSPVQSELSLDDDISGEKRITLAERTHRNVLSGPFADSPEAA
jgi:hypothetical protein